MSEWWNAQPPGFTTTGTRSGSTPSGVAPSSGASQFSGRVEAAAVGRRLRPQVRAAHVLDRAALGEGLVERDPAGDHLGRAQVGGVRAVLVHAQRLRAGRLPQAVVLEHAGAAVAAEAGGDAAGSSRSAPGRRSGRRRASRCRSGGSRRRGRGRASSSPRRGRYRWRSRRRTERRSARGGPPPPPSRRGPPRR